MLCAGIALCDLQSFLLCYVQRFARVMRSPEFALCAVCNHKPCRSALSATRFARYVAAAFGSRVLRCAHARTHMHMHTHPPARAHMHMRPRTCISTRASTRARTCTSTWMAIGVKALRCHQLEASTKKTQYPSKVAQQKESGGCVEVCMIPRAPTGS